VGGGAEPEPPDPYDRIEERLVVVAAMQELRQLPKRVQQAVAVRSQVWRQTDVATILGVNTARVNHLLASASV
jgi:hypothetical protein